MLVLTCYSILRKLTRESRELSYREKVTAGPAMHCCSFIHLDVSPYAYSAYLSDSYVTDTVLRPESAIVGHGSICETCSLVQGLDNDGPCFWPRLKAVTHRKPHP